MAAASGVVLVVDDDDAFRELVRTLLERAGFAPRAGAALLAASGFSGGTNADEGARRA